MWSAGGRASIPAAARPLSEVRHHRTLTTAGAMCVAVPASTVGLGHSTLSIPHLVRSGKSSSVVRR